MWSIVRHATAAGLLVLTAAGCTESVIRDVAGPGTFVPPPTVAPPAPPPALRVYVGPDMFVALPDSALSLRVSASDAYEGRILDIRWTKMTGPASYRISGADGFAPEINGLQRGRYTFEIAVRDGAGGVAADTLAIHVLDSAAVQAMDFPARPWICPMGCSSSIANIGRLVRDGALMRVQLRSGTATAWEEVRTVRSVNEKYIYTVHNDDLVLFADDEPTPSDVRVLWVKP